jgi:hypothetical protein
MLKTFHALFVAAALSGLAACQSPIVYGPQASPGATGYTDKQLAENRFRVAFHGNSSTSREVVEDFLMRRAAEVTLQAGCSAFLFDTRDTKAKTRYMTDFAGWPGWGGYGSYWHDWDMGGTSYSNPITSYTAYAEIILLKPDQAAKEPRSLGAQDVLNHLAPKS